MLEIGNLEQWEKQLNSEFAIIVEFTQPTCMPCRKLGAILQMVEPEHLDVKFLKVDVTRLPQIAGLYGIMSTPTTLLIKDKKVKAYVTGMKTKAEINNLLAK